MIEGVQCRGILDINAPKRREKHMNNYHVVIGKRDGEIDTIGPWYRQDANEVVRELAVNKYSYEKETRDMQKMFGNYNKCGGILFKSCQKMSVFSSAKTQIKVCADECPRKTPDCGEYLRLYVADTIIIISAEHGEIWRNR
jgi:hypothetical protein